MISPACQTPTLPSPIFVGKVRLYSILMEDVLELREFNAKHCRVACFSRGGQYFAFANNSHVREEVARIFPSVSVFNF